MTARPYIRRFSAHWRTGDRTTIELRYDPADPLAIHLGPPNWDDNDDIWAFARDLLADGLDSRRADPAGIPGGDVHSWSDPPYVPVRVGDEGPRLYIRLMSPDGVAELSLRRNRAAGFLAATAVMVPFGKENPWPAKVPTWLSGVAL
jgi:hypothetical protein